MIKLHQLARLTNHGVSEVARINAMAGYDEDDDVPTDIGKVTALDDDNDTALIEFNDGTVIEVRPEWLIPASDIA